MTTQMQLTWRRHKVLEFLSKGHSQVEISTILQVDESIISRDVLYLRKQSKEKIKEYVDEKLPEEYEKCLTGLNSILKETWNISQNTNDNREKIQALSLAKECYSMRLDLLTNVNVVNDVIRFISSTNNNIISSQSSTKKIFSSNEKVSSSNNNHESNVEDRNNTNDDKNEKNKVIMEKEEDDFQRFTEDNNSAGSSTYNSVF